MPTLRLHRYTNLTPSEIGQLPGGTVGVRGSSDVVARVEFDGSLDKLVLLAFRLGQAVPDAKLSAEGLQLLGTLGSSAEASMAPTGAEEKTVINEAGEEEPAPKLPTKDLLTLLREGDLDSARDLLGEKGLTSAEQGDVRRLFMSTEPEDVVVACLAARLSSHRTFAMNIRRHLKHADSRVRLAATEALGALGGPSLVPAIRGLLGDANPEIVAAAEAAIARIEGD